MLTAKQRFALANAVRLLQGILDEDDEGAASTGKRRSTLRDAADKKANILRDHHQGLPVKTISEKYNLSHQYIHSVIRKDRKAGMAPDARRPPQQAGTADEASS